MESNSKNSEKIIKIKQEQIEKKDIQDKRNEIYKIKKKDQNWNEVNSDKKRRLNKFNKKKISFFNSHRNIEGKNVLKKQDFEKS
jgi:hypothetical protein